MERPLLNTFFAKRERLIAELQASARRVNAWWAEREESDPTLHELARLEGLLAERRMLLEQMIKLDDDMLGRLVEARGQRSSTGN